VLLAFACVDRNGVVGRARLFQEQRDFGGVWRSAVIKFQRICLLRIGLISIAIAARYVLPQAIAGANFGPQSPFSTGI
jgi:hypothetical protein